MKRILVFSFGLVSYLIFFAVFLYWIGFMDNLLVPKGIDSGTTGSIFLAIIINFPLVTIFGLQHSIMARGKFKKWLVRFVPQAAERSVYVLISSLILILLFWLWKPVEINIWHIESSAFQIIIYSLFALGWVILLISTFLINHFELFGLQQIYFNLRNRPMKSPEFQMPLFYRIVRHPMMIGVIIAIWATPDMTLGHMMFSVFMTGYIFIGTYFEEKDLVKHFGGKYIMYRSSVPKMIPIGKKKLPDEISTLK
jgi:methanethiol S-methyltransferase